MNKKLLLLLAAVAAALLVAGCEKHAYSVSTNIFRYSTGKSFNDVTNKLSLSVGETAYIIATSSSGTPLEGGVYSVSASPVAEPATEENPNPQTPSEQKAVKVAPDGRFDGRDCIVVNAIGQGNASVSLNYEVMGFKLYKTITVTVK